jgi:hypothetical protein
MSAYIKRTERSQNSNQMLHLKFLEKQEQAKPVTSIRREMIKIRTEINKIQTTTTTTKNIQRFNEKKKLVL